MAEMPKRAPNVARVCFKSSVSILVAGWLFACGKSGAHRENLPSAKVAVWQKAAPILDRRSGAPLGSV
jgi:hypothetical protein